MSNVVIGTEGMKLYDWQIYVHRNPSIICNFDVNYNEQYNIYRNWSFNNKSELCKCVNHKCHFDCLNRLCTHWKSKPEKNWDKSNDEGCKYAELIDIIVLNRRKKVGLNELKFFLTNNIEIIKWLDWRHLNSIVQSYNQYSKNNDELAICAIIDTFHMYQKFENHFSGGNVRGCATSLYNFRSGEWFCAKIKTMMKVIEKDDILHRIFCAINAWNVLYNTSLLNKIVINIKNQRYKREKNNIRFLFNHY